MHLQPAPDLPAAVRPRLERARERVAPLGVELPEALAASAPRVLATSEFVLNVLLRRPEALAERLRDPAPLTAEALAARLCIDGRPEAEALAALRRARQVEMARIAWRDIGGHASVETTLEELSALADGMIGVALRYAVEALEPRYGRPRDAAGRDVPLLVLGMGKLGGRELNFSSDIDLVFLFPEADVGDSIREEPEQYYRRLAQLLIKLLEQPTDEGLVFRVDTRLRPFGASGPLAISVPAFEAYLVRHGRDWERYAYVKARLVTGHEHEAELFGEILTPFVYRRYLDFGVFASLREMKALISREMARRAVADNVKLGPGGIREIEFIVQALQLVRGGRNPALRTRSLLEALALLAADRQLAPQSAEALADAYRFLRAVENRLQALDDAQTHDLPRDEEGRARLAAAMSASSWEALERELARHRADVEREFGRVAFQGSAAEASERVGGIKAAWEAGAIEEIVAGTALAQDEEAVRLLAELRRGALYQRMDEPSRQRLAGTIARIVPLIADLGLPASALTRVLPVLQAVCRRSAYLALLNESPAALERLLRIASRSALLARHVAEHPLLLDELLDARLFDSPPTREELEKLLERQLGSAAPDDVEAVLDAMRHFHRTAVFRIAVADLLGALPIMKVSDRLTDTAELVLELALRTAWRELTAKHGVPMYGSPGHLVEAGFAVIGYGKLGGLELGYGSDLDLVFLHDSTGAHQETTGPKTLDNERFFARLVQRLIHFLTIQTTSGRLYEVDTRLRPDGRRGLLVASLDNFRRYQRNEAWTWEHQALLRSRPLAGSPRVREAFGAERLEVLTRHVHRDRLKDDVLQMRLRMRKELSQGGPDTFDLKQDPGGIVDIEFLVDYWVLASSDRYPELVEFPDNVRQLEALERTGLVPAERCAALKEAYLTLRRRVHELALDERGRVVPADELVEIRRFVTAVWDQTFGVREPL
ncbi:MAG TPA: bifunctional [glutamate--ammonia ligase]-adenylyl-L-tyrosine phosphorylase/[glutamate--ammonia-ligase] adenylyltransferase [Gammaproteobacteria bacterium]